MKAPEKFKFSEVPGLRTFLLVSAIILLILCVVLGVYLPLYTDEVLWRALYARFFLEGGQLINLIPACNGTLALQAPSSWIPWRALDSWVYGDLRNPMLIRWVGIGTYVLWMTLFVWGARRIVELQPSEVLRKSIQTLSMGPLTWCLLPLLFVVNRPEQSLVAGTVAIVVGTVLVDRKQVKVPAYLTLIFVLLACSYVMAAHPKSIFLTPLLLLCASRIPAGRWFRLLAASCVIWFSFDTLRYSMDRVSCPDAPTVASKFSGALMLGLEGDRNFFGLLRRALENLFRFQEYFDGAGFQSYTGNAWLWFPEDTYSTFELQDFLNLTASVLIYGSIGFLMLVRGYQSRQRIFQPFRWSIESQMAVLILLGLITACTFQGAKAFYEITWFLPLAMLAFCLLAVRARLEFFGKAVHRLSSVYLVFSVCSLGFLLIHFVPVARSEWLRPGSPVDRGNQMSVQRFNEQYQLMFAAAAKCGIPQDRSLQHLVVDDFTYLGFHHRSIQPINAFFLRKDFREPQQTPLGVLQRFSPEGLITRCSSLPEELLNASKSDQGYCCLSASDLRE